MHLNLPFVFNILLGSVVLADTVATTDMAGAMLVGNNGSFHYIRGTFIAPNVSGPTGSGAAVMVGIGVGDGCNNFFRAVVEFLAGEEGGQSCTPRFEWYPHPSYQVSNLSISAGHTVLLGAGLNSGLSGGTFYIENLSTGQYAYKSVETPYPPCTKVAGWMVGGYVANGGMVPFASFTPVTFTEAVAWGSNPEQRHNLQDAKVVEMYSYSKDHVDIRAYVSSMDLDTLTVRRGSG